MAPPGNEVVKTQASYDLALRRFVEAAKGYREAGYLRRVDKKGKAPNGIVKRSARLLLHDFTNGEDQEGLMLSSKLAMVGFYDEIMDYLEETFHQDIDEKAAADLLGLDDPSFPLLCHDKSYGDTDEASIIKFQSLFACTEVLPDYNLFNLIQISEKLRGVKLDDSDRIGFKSKKRGSYYTCLKKLYEQNQTRIAAEKEIKYLKLVGVSGGANPTAIKIIPDSRLATYTKAEIEITLGEEKFIMYLLLGKYMDNKAFLKQLALELKMNISDFDGILETMKTLTKVRRAPNPKEVEKQKAEKQTIAKKGRPAKPYTELKAENKKKQPPPKKKRVPPKRKG